MRPDKIQHISIDRIDDLVTNHGTQSSPSTLAVRSRGFRHDKEGTVAYRDFGTIHRYAGASYPSGITILNVLPLYCPDDGKTYRILVGLDSSNNTRIYVDDGSGGAFSTEIGQVLGGVISSVSGTSVVLKGGDDLKDLQSLTYQSGTLVNNQVAGFVVYNATAGGYSMVQSNGGNTLTMLHNVELAFPTAWAADNIVSIFRTSGLTVYYPSNGTTPHIRWIKQEGQTKATFLYGSSAASPVPRQPMIIRRGDFVLGSTINLADKWMMERGGGLLPYCASLGSPGSPLASGVWAGSTDVGEGLRVTHAITTEAHSNVVSQCFTRTYFTLVYNGYQESDPVYASYLSGATSGNMFPKATYTIKINPALLNKNVTGINIYLARNYASALGSEGLTNWAEDYEDAVLFKEIELSDTSWSLTATTNYCMAFTYMVDAAEFIRGTTESQITLLGALGHAPIIRDADSYGMVASVVLDTAATGYTAGDEVTLTGGTASVRVLTVDGSGAILTYEMATNGAATYTYADAVTTTGGSGSGAKFDIVGIIYDRGYLSPRYITKASRSQESIVVIDDGDRTLRLTSYDGYGVHQDDNFPDSALDNNNKKHLITLQGDGRIMGLSMTNQDVVVIRPTQIEIVDIISGITRVYQSDCIAKDSIAEIGIDGAHLGVAWAGAAGIYFLGSDGSGQKIINQAWKNFYDGTLTIPGTTTPYMSDAQRVQTIIGYDPKYTEILVHVTCTPEAGSGTEYLTFRQNIQTKKWNVRQFNIGTSLSHATAAVKKFVVDTDGYLTIVSNDGIVKYPNLDRTLLPYQDDVASNGTTANKGIPTSLKISFGQLYNLFQNFVLWEYQMDYTATVSSSATATIGFYPDNVTTAFTTHTQKLDEAMKRSKVAPMGQIKSLQMAISLDGTLTNYTNLEIHRIELGVIPQWVIGNI